MARILIVDDDPVVATLLSVTLATAGHQVLLAHDMAQGLELTQSQSLTPRRKRDSVPQKQFPIS